VPARHLIGYDSDLGIWGYGDWWSRDFRPIEIHLMVWMDSIRCVITSIEGGGGQRPCIGRLLTPLHLPELNGLDMWILKTKMPKIAKNAKKMQSRYLTSSSVQI
jgi:hypothetical protein